MHAVGVGEARKGKGKAKATEEGDETGGEGKGWRHFPMYDDRTLGDMMRDIIAATAAMVEAKEKGMKDSVYRDWVDTSN